MVNMFANAAKIDTTAKKPAKKSDREEVNIAGIEDLASIDAVMKSLEALRKTIESSVKDQMHNTFVINGEKAGKKPESFLGVEAGASASCELRKRSTASVLTDEEAELLDANGITYDTVETTKECFVINPVHGQNQELLAKVSEALSTVEGLPEDFIMMQQGVTKRVVTDDSVDQVFSKKIADDLLGVVGVLAVKPKIEGGDIAAALAKISKIVK